MSLNYNLLVSEVDFRRKKDAKKMKKKVGKSLEGKKKGVPLQSRSGRRGTERETEGKR